MTAAEVAVEKHPVPKHMIVPVSHDSHAVSEATRRQTLFVVEDRLLAGARSRFRFGIQPGHPNTGGRLSTFNSLIELLINGDEEAVRVQTVADVAGVTANAAGIAIAQVRSRFSMTGLPWPFRRTGRARGIRIHPNNDVALCDARTQICVPNDVDMVPALLDASEANPNVPHLVRTESCRSVATVAMRHSYDRLPPEVLRNLQQATIAYNDSIKLTSQSMGLTEL